MYIYCMCDVKVDVIFINSAHVVYLFQVLFTVQQTGAVEYIDCISAEG